MILTPASLVTQWVDELAEKFFEELTPIEDPDQWRTATRAIASYDRARQEAHARQLLRHRWDLVIVDEAHKCKNHLTARYKLLQQIRRNYLLLLTATPIQNSLSELWGLVQYVEPTGTLLGDLGTFRAVFCGADDRELREDQAQELRRRLATVCRRTLRRQAQPFMRRPFVDRRE